MWRSRVEYELYAAEFFLRKIMLKNFIAPINWKWSSVGEICFQNWNLRKKKSVISTLLQAHFPWLIRQELTNLGCVMVACVMQLLQIKVHVWLIPRKSTPVVKLQILNDLWTTKVELIQPYSTPSNVTKFSNNIAILSNS